MKKKRTKYLLALAFFLILPGLVSAADWYVRPEGGSYGSENGINYANAWDGLGNVVWGSGGVQAGDNLYICGFHLRNFTEAPGEIQIRVGSGSGDNSRINIRGDCPNDPGIVWGAGIMNHEEWVYEGGNTWSITLPKNIYSGWFFEDVTLDSWTIPDKVSSLEECKATPGSYYSDSYIYNSKFYVHTSDNGNPTGRIAGGRLGYRFVIDGAHHVNFLNLKLYSMHRYLDWASTPPKFASYIKWENCTLWYGEKLILFFKEGSHHIEIIGCDIGWAQNGVGFSESPPRSLPNAPHHYVIRDNYFHHFGVRIPDSDSHAIGAQGSHHGIVENNEFYMGSTTICYYAYPDTSITNTTVRWNYVHDCHTIGGNGRGIAFNSGGPDIGNLSGNKAYGNIIANCTCGIRSKWEQDVEIYNNVAYNCGISYEVYNHVSNSRAKLRNSISLNPETLHVYYRTGSTVPGSYLFDSDYNLFYPLSGDQFRFTRIVGGSTVSDYYTFLEWQAINDPNCPACVWDPNSLTVDPLFGNPENRNFYPQENSPAIDAGVSVGVAKDFRSIPIPQGDRIDIGAYEYVDGEIVIPDLNGHEDEGNGAEIDTTDGNGATETTNATEVDEDWTVETTNATEVTETSPEFDIAPETTKTIKNSKSKTGVNQVQMEAKNQVQNVKIIITRYEEKPVGITEEKSGKVYRYLQIKIENLGDNLNKSVIEIQVERNWVYKNNIKKNNIALFKFDESSEEWSKLSTTFTDEDYNYYYYDVELDSFSYFAIVGLGGEEKTGVDKFIGVIRSNLFWILIGVISLIIVISLVSIFLSFKRHRRFKESRNY